MKSQSEFSETEKLNFELEKIKFLLELSIKSNRKEEQDFYLKKEKEILQSIKELE